MSRPPRVVVTGDFGEDTFTRNIAGCVPDTPIAGDDGREAGQFHPEIAHDVDVPSGASLIAEAMSILLPDNFTTQFEAPFRSPSLSRFLQYLKAVPWGIDRRKVLRIVRMTPLNRPQRTPTDASSQESFRAFSEASLNDADYLIIHDATRLWRTSQIAGDAVRSFLANHSSNSFPRIIVNIGRNIPSLTIKEGEILVDGLRSPVWNELWQHRDKVVIALSATDLRHAGAAISRRLSWEQTVEDTLSDMQLFERFSILAGFSNVVIRFGFVGALHLSRLTGESKGSFIYAPAIEGGVFREEDRHGRIFGRGAIFAASLVRALSVVEQQAPSLPPSSETGTLLAKLFEEMEHDPNNREVFAQLRDQLQDPTAIISDAFAEAIRTTLLTSMTLYDGGFSCPSKLPDSREYTSSFFSGNANRVGGTGVSPQKMIQQGYSGLLKDKTYSVERDRYLGRVTLPTKILEGEQQVWATPNWQILRSQVRDERMSRINLGIAICRFGHHHVLNRPWDIEIPGEPISGIDKNDIIAMLKMPECRLAANELADDQPLNGSAYPSVPYPSNYIPEERFEAKPLFVPMLSFGKLVAIERDEIETFRSMQNLFRNYILRGAENVGCRPMSIAVFGTPGTGKSFTVKEIARSTYQMASGVDPLEIIECNVAQFRTVADLGDVMTRIANANNNHRVPLVFFDEFDCEFEDAQLGWLKYFLGPMQDGSFMAASKTITFGRAIFVFAGGIYSKITEFVPTELENQPTDPADYARRVKLFRKQKGPDFVSRLRGHINIRSVNPEEEGMSQHASAIKPVIRRSLILRELIISQGFVGNRDGCLVAHVDDDLLYALLTVDAYRHGVRSMEAILQMCNPIRNKLEKASLPSRAQLNMHVDSEEFLIRVQRGRYRTSLAASLAKKSGNLDAQDHSCHSEKKQEVSQDTVSQLKESRHPDRGNCDKDSDTTTTTEQESI